MAPIPGEEPEGAGSLHLPKAELGPITLDDPPFKDADAMPRSSIPR